MKCRIIGSCWASFFAKPVVWPRRIRPCVVRWSCASRALPCAWRMSHWLVGIGRVAGCCGVAAIIFRPEKKPPAGLRGAFGDMSQLGQQPMLLWADANTGDQLLLTRFVTQFLGCWEQSNITGQTLWLRAAPRLVPLLQIMFPAIRVLSAGQVLPPELSRPHAKVPMFDLPVLLESNNVPPPPRLSALPAELLNRWKLRIGSRRTLRCGVAWSAESGLSRQLAALIAASPEIEWHAVVSGAAERHLVASGLPVVKLGRPASGCTGRTGAAFPSRWSRDDRSGHGLFGRNGGKICVAAVPRNIELAMERALVPGFVRGQAGCGTGRTGRSDSAATG